MTGVTKTDQSLTFSNYFSTYALCPFSESLTTEDKVITLAVTIFLSVATVGLYLIGQLLTQSLCNRLSIESSESHTVMYSKDPLRDKFARDSKISTISVESKPDSWGSEVLSTKIFMSEAKDPLKYSNWVVHVFSDLMVANPSFLHHMLWYDGKKTVRSPMADKIAERPHQVDKNYIFKDGTVVQEIKELCLISLIEDVTPCESGRESPIKSRKAFELVRGAFSHISLKVDYAGDGNQALLDELYRPRREGTSILESIFVQIDQARAENKKIVFIDSPSCTLSMGIILMYIAARTICSFEDTFDYLQHVNARLSKPESFEGIDNFMEVIRKKLGDENSSIEDSD